jgi:8-oxo-dGTP diphosphatase
MSGPIVAVGGIARRGDALLLVRRGHGPAAGTWSVPGGRVEAGETLHEAVVREVAEETGLHVVVERFLGWAEILDDDHFVILDFVVTLLDADAVPVPGDDAAEVEWVDVSELSERQLAPGLLEFLEDTGILGDSPCADKTRYVK